MTQRSNKIVANYKVVERLIYCNIAVHSFQIRQVVVEISISESLIINNNNKQDQGTTKINQDLNFFYNSRNLSLISWQLFLKTLNKRSWRLEGF